jgi:hypothetical protein
MVEKTHRFVSSRTSKIGGFNENKATPQNFTPFVPSFDRWSKAGVRRPENLNLLNRRPLRDQVLLKVA